MLAGNWLDNGEAIHILSNGYMGNGHHRINAVILASETDPNIIVTLTFIFGIKKEAQRTFDLGKNRSAGDRFKIDMQIDHGDAIASAIRLFDAYQKERRTTGGKDNITIQDIMNNYAKNRHTYDGPVARIAGKGMARKLNEGALIAAYLILAVEKDISITVVNVFFDQLIHEEELERDGHIARLREKLAPKVQVARKRGFRPWEKVELILRYWAYFINDKALPNRGLRVEGVYPKIETGNTPFEGMEEDKA